MGGMGRALMHFVQFSAIFAMSAFFVTLVRPSKKPRNESADHSADKGQGVRFLAQNLLPICFANALGFLRRCWGRGAKYHRLWVDEDASG